MRGAPHPRYFPGWSGPHFLCKGSQSLFFLCFRSPFGFPSRVSFRFRFPSAFWFPPSGFPSGFPLLPLSSLCSSFGRWFPVGFRLPLQVSRRPPLPGSLALRLASRFASLEVIPNVKHRSRPCQGTFAPVSGDLLPDSRPDRKQEQDDLAGTMRHLGPPSPARHIPRIALPGTDTAGSRPWAARCRCSPTCAPRRWRCRPASGCSASRPCMISCPASTGGPIRRGARVASPGNPLAVA